MYMYLICQKTKKKYDISEPLWRSPDGSLLDLEFKAKFPISKIKNRPPTMWRYREAIPIIYDKNIVSFCEGFTPLIEVKIDERIVLLKQEQLFPSGSFKDRGASVLISKVKELGIKKIVEDSSGNAGSAIAAYCAKAGISCDIYVSASASKEKLVQIEMYGANLHKISGSREDAANAALEAAEKNYYASHAWNPFFFHGTKTFVFEIIEQLGWKIPDVLIVPVAHGTLLYGSFLGLQELKNAGIIKRFPKIIGVQAKNCAPLYESWKNQRDGISKISKKYTIAEGIAIAEPIRAKQILQAIRETGGEIIVVSESEIKRALKDTVRKGFYIEPTSASTIAGIKKYNAADEKIVAPLTGHGLKASGTMLKL